MFLNFLFLFSLNVDSSDRVGPRVIPLVLLGILAFSFVLFYLEQLMLTDWMQNGVFLWYAVFAFYNVLSLTWALRPRKYAFANFKGFIIILILLFIYGVAIQREEDIVLCLKSIVWANMGTVIAMVRKMELANLFSGRAGDALGLNSNVFGVQCALAALLSLYLFKDNKKYIICIGILGFMSLLSGSRKAFFMLVIGIALYKILEIENGYVIRNILIIIILVAILLFLVLKVPQLYNIIGHRLEAMFSEHKDGSINERRFYKQEAMRLFSQNPIFGSGFDSFKTHLMNMNYKHPAYSHCNYTEILSTLGIVGAILYYIMYMYVFIKSYKRKDALTRILFICFLCTIIAEYGAVLFNNTIYIILIGLLYFRINIKSYTKIMCLHGIRIN